MSKKMMKRSLALGALMAFVITGSAMAASVTDGEEFTGRITESELKGSGVETIYVVGEATSTNNPSVVDGTTVKDIKKVVFKGDWGTGSGGAVNAVQAGAASTVEFKNINNIGYEGEIDVTGNDTTVLFHAYGGTIKLDEIETIKLNYGGSAFYANGYDGNDGKIVVTNVGTIEASSVYAYNYGYQGNASIDIQADNVILNSKGMAIYACSNGTDANSVNITANEKLEISGTGMSGGYDYGVICSYYGGENNDIELNAKEVIITNTNGGTAINTYGSSIEIGKGSETVNITGDVFADGAASVDVNLGTNGSLTGTVIAYTDGDNISLDLGTNSVWNVKSDSWITAIDGEGTVSVGADTNVYASFVSETTTVAANAEYAEALADDGEISKEEMEALQEQLTGAKNAMVGETALTGVTTLTADGGYVSNANVSNAGIRDMASLALVAWRAENNDMNKRLGELRNANGEHGVWVRMVRGESEYSTVKNQYNTYQLGYDEKLSTDESWTVGMALSYTDGESSFERGNGENTSKAVAFYGSKLNADGSFVDLIAKYARIENEYDITGGVGGAEYDANGYSVSVEYGKRFEQDNGLWIEPQVELTYGKVGSADYMTKKGYKVAQDGMESLVGRLGFSLGKDVKGGNVYARASYLYDFDGETELTFADKVKMEQDLGGGWWEVGVGANINLSKATYIYADIEKTFGGEVDTNWQWNLGVRYSF